MKKTTSVIIKLLKSIEKEKKKSPKHQRKETWDVQKPNRKTTADFSSEAVQVRRRWGNISRGLKGGRQGGVLCLLALPTPQKRFFKNEGER